ncbi:isoamyl acetate-hydrolyzing esterase [Rhodotorula sphaerocarpa]
MSIAAQSDLFVCIGDSLTEQSWGQNGLGATLADLYRRKLDVVNRGLGGYNTDWGLEAFKRYFPKKADRTSTVQLMTIWWGANDSTLPGQTQHVPLDRFRSNIRDLVSLVRDPASTYHSPETSIVLINAPSFYPEHWLDEKERKGQPREVDRDLGNTKRYAEEVKSLGQELGLPVADAYAAVERAVQQVGADQPREIWSDGLHLTGKAYAATAYPDKHWDRLPMTLPDWKDIPQGAFGPAFSIDAKAEQAVEAAVAAGTDPF